MTPIVSPRTSWAAPFVLTATAGAAVVAWALPAARSPGILLAAWASVLLVAGGVRRYRPRPVLPWALVAAMLGLWAVGTTIVQLQAVRGIWSVVLEWSVGAGQALAAVLAVLLIHHAGGRAAGRGPAGGPDRRIAVDRGGTMVDILVIATVFALVLVQVVAVSQSSTGRGGDVSMVLVPTVDVAVAGLLLRVLVLYAGLQTSTLIALSAAVVTIFYDLFAHLGGHRLAPPGAADQVLGIVCVLLFGVSAVHPSMVTTFDGATFRRRPPSSAFFGLFPLVVIPPALWAVARAAGTPGLPTPALLLAGSVLAGLCLVRGGLALKRTEHLAEHDALTGLLNRRGLARMFAQEPPGGWTVLLIDLDDFKQVNDTHGHDVGDGLLLVIRDRLLDVAPRGGAVARLGGDEFVMLTAVADSPTVVAELLDSARRPIRLGDIELTVSASIGIAPEAEGTPIGELLTRADVAMYAAKAAGRNTAATFDPQMRIDVARRYGLTAQIRRLLTDTAPAAGMLAVFYQPLIELRSGAVVGAEALVRWRHPTLGLLQPGDFLELVTATGLDLELDEAVLVQITADLAWWRREGRVALPVSLNLTRASLTDPGTAGRILDRLAQAGLPARLLDVEITEHERLPDDLAVAANLHRLAAAGVGIHLDDYGTGYTSLDYLRRFPITVLKLDRSVVVGVETDGDILIEGIAAMAATLDVDLLAEGVETPRQRDRLIELGVRYGQGWLFHRAMPAEQYARTVLCADHAADLAADHAGAVVPDPGAPVTAAEQPR